MMTKRLRVHREKPYVVRNIGSRFNSENYSCSQQH
jgi:hypothetical protein